MKKSTVSALSLVRFLSDMSKSGTTRLRINNKLHSFSVVFYQTEATIALLYEEISDDGEIFAYHLPIVTCGEMSHDTLTLVVDCMAVFKCYDYYDIPHVSKQTCNGRYEVKISLREFTPIKECEETSKYPLEARKALSKLAQDRLHILEQWLYIETYERILEDLNRVYLNTASPDGRLRVTRKYNVDFDDSCFKFVVDDYQLPLHTDFTTPPYTVLKHEYRDAALRICLDHVGLSRLTDDVIRDLLSDEFNRVRNHCYKAISDTYDHLYDFLYESGVRRYRYAMTHGSATINVRCDVSFIDGHIQEDVYAVYNGAAFKQTIKDKKDYGKEKRRKERNKNDYGAF